MGGVVLGRMQRVAAYCVRSSRSCFVMVEKKKSVERSIYLIGWIAGKTAGPCHHCCLEQKERERKNASFRRRFIRPLSIFLFSTSFSSLFIWLLFVCAAIFSRTRPSLLFSFNSHPERELMDGNLVKINQLAPAAAAVASPSLKIHSSFE